MEHDIHTLYTRVGCMMSSLFLLGMTHVFFHRHQLQLTNFRDFPESDSESEGKA
jgi:hypothetical protein